MRIQTDKGLIRHADGCIRFSGDAPLGVLLSSMCGGEPEPRSNAVYVKPERSGRKRNSGMQGEVLEILKDQVAAGQPQIAALLGLEFTMKNRHRISACLCRMVQRGDAVKVARGMYAANSNAEVPARDAKGCGGVSVRGGAVKAAQGGGR